jgi:hypothetical protein
MTNLVTIFLKNVPAFDIESFGNIESTFRRVAPDVTCHRMLP